MPQPYQVAPPTGSDPADEWVRLGLEAQLASNGLTDKKLRDAKLAEAQGKYQQALRLDPRHPIATMNLALVFAQVEMLNEALLTIERAAMFDGVLPIIPTNHALLALEANQIDVALEQAHKAAAMAPKGIEGNHSRLALAMVLASAGLSNQALPVYSEILESNPKDAQAAGASCFIQTLCDSSLEDLLAQRKHWHEQNKYTGTVELHRNSRDPDRTLRIGYVSGDFKQHSAAGIFGNVLLNHTDKQETFYYSTLPVDPATDLRTKQFKDKAGNRWRDISTTSDEDADLIIRKDRIDILVDLAAHTNGGRLSIFLRKPAPIQVTAWGFAHGTGCPEIDYFFADPVAVPEEDRKYFEEKIWDLPCMLTYFEPKEYQLKGTSLPAIRKNGYLTFGSYARYEKMSDECLELFAEILRRVPDSKMEFKDYAYRRPYSIRRIMRLMKGIEPERLLFSLATSHSDHMLAYQQADLCLDPFPHCGGVVSLEQLYMGVPIITMYGRQTSGRNTSSVLTAMGRGEWIARSPQEYVEKAVEWSERTKDLADARKTLRNELLNSPVVKDYAIRVEEAYREIWRKWCDK